MSSQVGLFNRLIGALNPKEGRGIERGGDQPASRRVLSGAQAAAELQQRVYLRIEGGIVPNALPGKPPDLDLQTARSFQMNGHGQQGWGPKSQEALRTSGTVYIDPNNAAFFQDRAGRFWDLGKLPFDIDR